MYSLDYYTLLDQILTFKWPPLHIRDHGVWATILEPNCEMDPEYQILHFDHNFFNPNLTWATILFSVVNFVVQ
jgi:hypothetical protein